MVSRRDVNELRLARHKKVRAKISGTTERPRLCVYRSLAHIRAQVIDDTKGVTLVSASTLVRNGGGFPDLCRTARSVWLRPLRGHHKTVRL